MKRIKFDFVKQPKPKYLSYLLTPMYIYHLQLLIHNHVLKTNLHQSLLIFQYH
nr:MAG TPA: hypothetical protein [Crassvirales sp.]